MINQANDPLLKTFRFRSIGPASMGGRIDDIAVSESDPNIIYVGYAVGGVFKSENNGTTFEPVFETYGTRLDRRHRDPPDQPDIVYVGTGEANNRQTSTFGDGIYKTTDGGKTFTNIGLKDTQTIARIVIDPKKPDTVYVASPGHLFGRTRSGASSKPLTGARPGTRPSSSTTTPGSRTSPSIRSTQQHPVCRELSAAGGAAAASTAGGPGSALWKTVDAGKTWTKVSGSGLRPAPTGGSRSTSHDRIRTSYLRRSKRAKSVRLSPPAAPIRTQRLKRRLPVPLP
jgi:hypothetical protein